MGVDRNWDFFYMGRGAYKFCLDLISDSPDSVAKEERQLDVDVFLGRGRDTVTWCSGV